MTENALFFGFDFGTKRTGVAVGQSITRTATPLTTLSMRSLELYPQLDTLFSKWRPQGLVVGLAFHANGEDSFISHQARAFGTMLSHRYQKPLYFADECFTSIEASRLPKQDQDAMAAAIILEAWLQQIPHA